MKYYISVKHPSYDVPLYIAHTLVRRLEHDISDYSMEEFSQMAMKEGLNISASMGFPAKDAKDGQMITMLVGARVTPNFMEAALFEELPNWDSAHYSAILRLFHECKQHLVVEELGAKRRLYSAGDIAKLAVVVAAAVVFVYLFQAPKINEAARPNKTMQTGVLPPAGANMKCDTVIRSGDTIFMYRKNK